MRRGQVMTAAIFLFSLVLLCSALWLKEAIDAIERTKVFWAGLQCKLLSQSGIDFASLKLKGGRMLEGFLSFEFQGIGKISLSFLPEREGTEVNVVSLAEVYGRVFKDEVVFSYPKGLGENGLAIFWCEPEIKTPLPPTSISLGKGLTKSSLVFAFEDENVKTVATSSFVGLDKRTLFGVTGDGRIVSGEIPSNKGIFTFDGWWRVPGLPGPFQILFPFSPISHEKVLGEGGVFRRTETIPRFPKQYFLDEEKGLFWFSEHEAGRSVLISGWQKGFRIYGPVYANASIIVEGTSLLSLLPNRGDRMKLTGKVFLSDESKFYFALPNQPLKEWSKEGESLKVQGFVMEEVKPFHLPKPSWPSFRSLCDPELGGEGIVLPSWQLLNLGELKVNNFVFFKGYGFVEGNVVRGRGWVVVFCDGTLVVRGSILVGDGSNLALVAREILWEVQPDKPFQVLQAFLLATDGSFQVLLPSIPKEPLRLVFVGSLNTNGVPKIEGEGWG